MSHDIKYPFPKRFKPSQHSLFITDNKMRSELQTELQGAYLKINENTNTVNNNVVNNNVNNNVVNNNVVNNDYELVRDIFETAINDIMHMIAIDHLNKIMQQQTNQTK